MAFAHRPRPLGVSGTDTLQIRYSEIAVPQGESLGQGLAVAVVPVNGIPTFQLCGALLANHGDKFLGFLVQSLIEGGESLVVAERGSKATPVVEGSAVLIPGQDVYLSIIPGQVTQIHVVRSDAVCFRLGYAISATQMLLVTENLVLGGG